MRSSAPIALAVFLTLVAVTLGTFQGARADGPYQEEMRQIARLLQCPVCQNLSVLDSPSPLATQMREVILEKLEAGEDREAILQYFIDRYGEGILLDPPKGGFTLGIWLGPLVMVLGGLALLVATLRSWLRRQAAASESPAPRHEHEIAAPDEPLGDPQGEIHSSRYEAWLQEELAQRTPLGAGGPATPKAGGEGRQQPLSKEPEEKEAHVG